MDPALQPIEKLIDHFWFQGKVVKRNARSRALLGRIVDNGATYGTRHFDAFRGLCVEGQPCKVFVFELSQHIERFCAGAATLGIALPYSPEEFAEVAHEMFSRAYDKGPHLYGRFWASRGAEQDVGGAKAPVWVAAHAARLRP